MRKLSVGQRVAAYDAHSRIVGEVVGFGDGQVIVRALQGHKKCCGTVDLYFAPQQLRRLKRRERREWELECTRDGWRVARHDPIKSRVGESVTVREVRRKK